MKISFSATNPCHMWATAHAVAAEGALGCYYSGYPAWKLPQSSGMHVRTHSFRTNIVYGLLKYAPPRLRPPSRSLFRWQDYGFDRWVGRHLENCTFIHAMPGQALHTFRSARKKGIRTVLNHATGPAAAWVKIMQPEYERVGLRLEDVCVFDAAYFEREQEEYSLADFHCAASSVVSTQLAAMGVNPSRIWCVPYGADTGPAVFHPSESTPAHAGFRILFAGQIGLRKGVKTLLDALTLAAKPGWQLDFVGPRLPEADFDLARAPASLPIRFHGSVPQSELAKRMAESSVLVLPSLEEGFGLVVPQALNCGCPCIVSDRVGAKDLILHRSNGSIFPVQNAESLAAELSWWFEHPSRTCGKFEWGQPARTLLRYCQSAQ